MKNCSKMGFVAWCLLAVKHEILSSEKVEEVIRIWFACRHARSLSNCNFRSVFRNGKSVAFKCLYKKKKFEWIVRLMSDEDDIIQHFKQTSCAHFSNNSPSPLVYLPSLCSAWWLNQFFWLSRWFTSQWPSYRKFHMTWVLITVALNVTLQMDCAKMIHVSFVLLRQRIDGCSLSLNCEMSCS